MGNDLAEIKERQHQLETYLSMLESRLDAQEALLDLAKAKIPAPAWSSAANAPAGEEDTGDARPSVQDVESLLRSIVVKQSMYSTELRHIARAQESGRSRLQSTLDGVAMQLDSIADTLRGIEGGRHDR